MNNERVNEVNIQHPRSHPLPPVLADSKYGGGNNLVPRRFSSTNCAVDYCLSTVVRSTAEVIISFLGDSALQTVLLTTVCPRSKYGGGNNLVPRRFSSTNCAVDYCLSTVVRSTAEVIISFLGDSALQTVLLTTVCPRSKYGGGNNLVPRRFSSTNCAVDYCLSTVVRSTAEVIISFLGDSALQTVLVTTVCPRSKYGGGNNLVPRRFSSTNCAVDYCLSTVVRSTAEVIISFLGDSALQTVLLTTVCPRSQYGGGNNLVPRRFSSTNCAVDYCLSTVVRSTAEVIISFLGDSALQTVLLTTVCPRSQYGGGNNLVPRRFSSTNCAVDYCLSTVVRSTAEVIISFLGDSALQTVLLTTVCPRSKYGGGNNLVPRRFSSTNCAVDYCLSTVVRSTAEVIISFLGDSALQTVLLTTVCPRSQYGGDNNLVPRRFSSTNCAVDYCLSTVVRSTAEVIISFLGDSALQTVLLTTVCPRSKYGGGNNLVPRRFSSTNCAVDYCLSTVVRSTAEVIISFLGDSALQTVLLTTVCPRSKYGGGNNLVPRRFSSTNCAVDYCLSTVVRSTAEVIISFLGDSALQTVLLTTVCPRSKYGGGNNLVPRRFSSTNCAGDYCLSTVVRSTAEVIISFLGDSALQTVLLTTVCPRPVRSTAEVIISFLGDSALQTVLVTTVCPRSKYGGGNNLVPRRFSSTNCAVDYCLSTASSQYGGGNNLVPRRFSSTNCAGDYCLSTASSQYGGGNNLVPRRFSSTNCAVDYCLSTVVRSTAEVIISFLGDSALQTVLVTTVCPRPVRSTAEVIISFLGDSALQTVLLTTVCPR
ncbi:hypothetical protein J6590_087784 [Homalodisca vitripennis]|nr:hypothetical protein J6590_087784 [Homalodisca vitripennis]